MKGKVCSLRLSQKVVKIFKFYFVFLFVKENNVYMEKGEMNSGDREMVFRGRKEVVNCSRIFCLSFCFLVWISQIQRLMNFQVSQLYSCWSFLQNGGGIGDGSLEMYRIYFIFQSKRRWFFLVLSGFLVRFYNDYEINELRVYGC